MHRRHRCTYGTDAILKTYLLSINETLCITAILHNTTRAVTSSRAHNTSPKGLIINNTMGPRKASVVPEDAQPLLNPSSGSFGLTPTPEALAHATKLAKDNTDPAYDGPWGAKGWYLYVAHTATVDAHIHSDSQVPFLAFCLPPAQHPKHHPLHLVHFHLHPPVVLWRLHYSGRHRLHTAALDVVD